MQDRAQREIEDEEKDNLLWRDGKNLRPRGEYELGLRRNMDSAASRTAVLMLNEYVANDFLDSLDKNSVLQSETRLEAAMRLRDWEQMIA